jgi:tetratricopeptide (TPR) repeat protein
VKSHDSVTVTAQLTPEENEDWKINEVYEPVFSMEEKGDCDAAIQRYDTEVIPLAEKSKFEVPRNKFLFLANRGIGICFMRQQHYEQAELSFQKTMEYLPVWPGTDDSDYPISFQQIATAQMGQQHWEGAEESLKRSVSLLDPRIEKAIKSDEQLIRSEEGGILRGEKARSLAYLAIVYLREGRTRESLETVDSAYTQATLPDVPPAFLAGVVNIGRSIAQTTGDKDAIAKWLRAGTAQK